MEDLFAQQQANKALNGIVNNERQFIVMPSDSGSLSSGASGATTYILGKKIPKNSFIANVLFYANSAGALKIKFYVKSALNFTLIKEFPVTMVVGLNNIPINWAVNDDVYIGFYSTLSHIMYKANRAAASYAYVYSHSGESWNTLATSQISTPLDFAVTVNGRVNAVNTLTASLFNNSNVFNYDNLVKGEYINYATGVSVGNSLYCRTKLTNIFGSMKYILTLPTTSDSIMITYYTDNGFLSGVNLISSSSNIIITPALAKYAIISLPIAMIDNFMIVPGINLPALYTPYAGLSFKDGVFNGAVKNCLIVAKSGGNYSTINDALNNANDSSDNRVSLLVYPGVYNEVVNIGGQRNISIIGVNRDTCIIRDDTGIYNNAPLRVEGNSYVANFSIISTHSNNPSFVPDDGSVNTWPSYAVHVDDPHPDDSNNYLCHFHNCYIYSENAPAAGCGGYKNQIIEFTNCEIVSNIPDAFYTAASRCRYGALYIHPKTGDPSATNERLIVKDCVIRSNRNEVFYTEHTGTGNDANLSMSFYNNVFWSEIFGNSATIFVNNTPTSIITADSFGNNLTALNMATLLSDNNVKSPVVLDLTALTHYDSYITPYAQLTSDTARDTYEMPCNPGDVFLITATVNGGATCMINVFNSTTVFSLSTLIDWRIQGGSLARYTDYQYVCPPNSKTIRICGITTGETFIIKKYLNINSPNLWYGKKIVWFGTSIPAGGGNGYNYPQMVGNMLGATLYNEAIGSSCVSSNMYLSMSMTITEKQAAAWWSGLSADDQTKAINSSWETILTKYLNGGSIGQVDLYIFDHGYNDKNYGDMTTVPTDRLDRSCFIGAMNFLIDKILSDNPKARILLIGHYENQLYPQVAIAQQKVADIWGGPIVKLWEKLGWSQQTVSTTGYWSNGTGNQGQWVPSGGSTQNLTILQTWLADGIHPHSDTSGKANQFVANNLIEEIRKFSS